jgi:hypothetical protein
LHCLWGCPRRPLAATVRPWSPDFPPPDLDRHNASIQQRPPGQLARGIRGAMERASRAVFAVISFSLSPSMGRSGRRAGERAAAGSQQRVLSPQADGGGLESLEAGSSRFGPEQNLMMPNNWSPCNARALRHRKATPFTACCASALAAPSLSA